VINCIIFDLSEVFIAGLLGVEHAIAKRLGVDPATIIPHLGGESFTRVLCGTCSELDYLTAVSRASGWNIPHPDLQELIRANFHQEVEGMADLLPRLALHHDLVLLSDHGREWVEYIETIHPFLKHFSRRIFSFQLGQTKSDASTFRHVLKMLSKNPEECLFIDDNPSNTARARQAGITSITFQNADTLEAELKALHLLPETPLRTAPQTL
jgi:HAD superfamily hydrolase (TIGR01509 family)